MLIRSCTSKHQLKVSTDLLDFYNPELKLSPERLIYNFQSKDKGDGRPDLVPAWINRYLRIEVNKDNYRDCFMEADKLVKGEGIAKDQAVKIYERLLEFDPDDNIVLQRLSKKICEVEYITGLVYSILLVERD